MRVNIIFGILILICLGLVGQLALMLHDAGKDCRLIAQDIQRKKIALPGREGDIFLRSRQGFVLAATSAQTPSCAADPTKLDDERLAEVAVKVGEAVNMDPLKIQEIIVSRRDRNYRWLKKDLTEDQLQSIAAMKLPVDIPDADLSEACTKLAVITGMDLAHVREAYEKRRLNQFVWLKRNISEEELAAILKLKGESRKVFEGILIKYEWGRHYPNNQLAASIVGFDNKDGVPGEGLEVVARRQLAAFEGARYNYTDVGKRSVMPDTQVNIPPKNGNDVYLTIDSFIQATLEQNVAASVEKHAAKWGVGVVMNPNTGEVLAMTTSPTFDPNQFNQVASPDARKNRCFVDPYEPGSAFKPLIAAAAVDAGIGVDWGTKFNCEGGVYNAPRGGTITDHGSAYGFLSLEDVVVFSSNIGMAKVGEKLGNAKVYEIVHKYGFGDQVRIQTPSGTIAWPGGSGGIIREPLRTWDGYSLRRVPFGQEISVTAMQLANAYCALVNGGELLQPRLIDSVLDADGKRVIWRSERKVLRRVIRPQVSRQAVDVMTQVVERGTGKACKLELWTSFGKTGTAQIAKNGQYPAGAFTSTFVGGAPSGKPALVCVISIHWPTRGGHYGATVAAPFVKDVLEKSLSYLDVRPDRPPTSVAVGPRRDESNGRD